MQGNRGASGEDRRRGSLSPLWSGTGHLALFVLHPHPHCQHCTVCKTQVSLCPSAGNVLCHLPPVRLSPHFLPDSLPSFFWKPCPTPVLPTQGPPAPPTPARELLGGRLCTWFTLESLAPGT